MLLPFGRHLDPGSPRQACTVVGSRPALRDTAGATPGDVEPGTDADTLKGPSPDVWASGTPGRQSTTGQRIRESYRKYRHEYGQQGLEEKLRERLFSRMFTPDDLVHCFVGNLAKRPGCLECAMRQ